MGKSAAMNETDFLTTFGREFASSLGAVVEAAGQDAYEAYSVAFGCAPSLIALRGLSKDELVRLRDAARQLLEAPTVEIEHVQEAVERTIWHCGQSAHH